MIRGYTFFKKAKPIQTLKNGKANDTQSNVGYQPEYWVGGLIDFALVGFIVPKITWKFFFIIF